MANYRVDLAGPVVRACQNGSIPTHIVDALIQLMDGPLSEIPRRVGKPLNPPFEGKWSARVGRDWRATYTISERHQLVTVTALRPRADAYRT